MKKYIDPKTVNLFDLVKDNKKVRFSFFRDSEFWYEQEDGFMFPISLAEAQSSRVTFLAEDRAILFMRWMKRYIEQVKKDIENSHPPLTQEQVAALAKTVGLQ